MTNLRLILKVVYGWFMGWFSFGTDCFPGFLGETEIILIPSAEKNFLHFRSEKTPIIVEAEELIKWKISLLKVPKKTTWAICIAVKVGKNIIVEYKPQTIPAQDKKVTDLISVLRVRTKNT
jgi:hypothetical protein